MYYQILGETVSITGTMFMTDHQRTMSMERGDTVIFDKCQDRNINVGTKHFFDNLK